MIAAMSVLVLLSGCATTAAKRTESGLDLDLVAKGKEGFVVLKVVSARPISLLNPKWQSIHVSADGKREELIDVTPSYNMLFGKHIPTESLYFAKLDAGEYEVTSMGSIGPGPGLLLALLASDHAAANEKLPRFKVEAGRLANLGTVVYVPEIEKEQPEQMFLLHGPAGRRAAKAALLGETQRAEISLQEGGGWTTVATAETEAGVLAQARAHMSMLSIRKTDRGLIAGSHLGQIFRRTGPQAWSQETLDTLGTVFAVAEGIDGRAFAGSQYGEYFVKTPSGEWHGYRLEKEAGRIAYIEPRADGSAIFIAGDLRQTRVWFKKSIEDSAEAPTQIAKIDTPPDNMLVSGKEIILAFNVPGMFREAVITRVDKQSLKVTSQREKFWVLDWQYLPDGRVNLTRQNGLSLYSSTSTDNLQTWIHSDQPGAISNYWYDASHGLSLDMSPGFIMVANNLRSTDDAGKTWTRLGKPLETRHMAGRIVYADADEILVQGSHMLYSTLDRGNTWKRLFPSTQRK